MSLPSIKLTGVRGMIAKKMRSSLQDHAQLTYIATVDARALLEARGQLKLLKSAAGLEDLLIQLVAKSLLKHPDHNGWVESKEAILFDKVDMGVAVATPGALMVPVVRDADSKSLEEIALSRKNLVARTRAGKLDVKDMTGGTFTISNLGLTRVEHFTPILNAPQIAILGIGRIVNRPCVLASGDIGSRAEMGLSLTTDHSIVDGLSSGEFLTTLANAIEKMKIG